MKPLANTIYEQINKDTDRRPFLLALSLWTFNGFTFTSTEVYEGVREEKREFQKHVFGLNWKFLKWLFAIIPDILQQDV